MTNLLQIKKESEVATITLNRPDKRNSLLPETLDALDSYLDDVASDKSIRILVITGAGEKAFCTGADLHIFSEHTPEEVRTKWVRRGHEIFRKLFEVPQVTIAKLNGDTLGGGLELALACSYRIASRTLEGATKFAQRLGTPERPPLQAVASAAEAIDGADVVVTDRLGPRGLLATLGSEVEVVDVEVDVLVVVPEPALPAVAEIERRLSEIRVAVGDAPEIGRAHV